MGYECSGPWAGNPWCGVVFWHLWGANGLDGAICFCVGEA